MPGIAPTEVQAELQRTVGPNVEVTPYPDLGRLWDDVLHWERMVRDLAS